MVPLGGGSSVGRAPGCGPGGRGFESRSPPFEGAPQPLVAGDRRARSRTGRAADRPHRRVAGARADPNRLTRFTNPARICRLARVRWLATAAALLLIPVGAAGA